MFIAVPSQLGYAALAGFVFGESAGLPIPGETALVSAGLLAGSGRLSLPVVIVVAASAAILGDNLGYVLGRRGGRAFLLRDGVGAKHRRRAVETGDRFFERHGAKTVFFGRWVSGVRIITAVMAGATRMPWRTFLVFNALGALAWASTITAAATMLGPVAVGILYVGGLVAAALFATSGGIEARRRRGVAAVNPVDDDVPSDPSTSNALARTAV